MDTNKHQETAETLTKKYMDAGYDEGIARQLAEKQLEIIHGGSYCATGNWED